MLKYLPLAFIALILLVRTFTFNHKWLTDYTQVDLPNVTAELVQKIEPGTIAAREPHIAWYLNCYYKHYPTFPFVTLPKTHLLDELHRRKVDYLYLGPSEWYARPELHLLWLPQNAPSDLKLIYHRPDLFVTVYQVMPTDRDEQ